MKETPAVSVLILNFNGKGHLERCFRSVEAQGYPGDRLEVLFLDNGSADGSVEFVRDRFPWVRVLAFQENLGYAAAMNRGAAEATRDLLVFLNNDTRLGPGALRHLVRPVQEERAAAAAAKIVSWDGRKVHFAGGGTNFHGIAFQVGMGAQDREEFRRESETLFACGAAMAIRKDLFLRCGGFDADFFAYYEDVDLGWRLWLLGHRVLYVPDALVYHHHSATSLRIELYKLRVLHVRNPLQMILKNYEEDSLRRILPAALLLSARRTWYLSGLDPTSFRIDTGGAGGGLRRACRAGRTRGDYLESMELPRLVASDLVALNDLLDKYPRILEKRESIQRERCRPDAEILGLFREPFRCAEDRKEYAGFQEALCRLLGIDELFRKAEEFRGSGGR